MLPRPALSPRSLPLLRSQLRRRTLAVGRRYQSTQQSVNNSGSSGVGTHLLAGLLGGGVVLGGVYTYYHWSGAAGVVQSAQRFKNSAVQVRDKALEKVPNTSEALTYLRQTARAYAVFIPGGKGYVDATFDNLEEVRGTHGEEVDGIVKQAYTELKGVVDGGGADLETAQKVAGILAKRGKQLGEVAKKASGDLLDKYPGAKEKLGKAYGEVEEFAKGRGEEGRRMMKELRGQLGEMLSQGGKSSDEVLKKAQEMLQSKQKEWKGVGEQAWEKGLEKAKPYLDKVPDLRKTLEENKVALAGVVASGGGAAGELWERVRKVAEGGKKEQKQAVEEFKGWVKEKAEQAQEGGEEGWDRLEDLIKQLPGGQSVLDATPEMKQYAEAFKQKAPEAQKVAREALEDIVNVLKEKGKKMEEIGKEGKEQAEKK